MHIRAWYTYPTRDAPFQLRGVDKQVLHLFVQSTREVCGSRLAQECFDLRLGRRHGKAATLAWASVIFGDGQLGGRMVL